MSLILVIDDEPDMRLALTNVLRKEGHTIVEAGDGESALKELEKHPVELVLLDLRLPGMDGAQTLRAIRQIRQDLPVVMVTGYGSVETAVKVMGLGATGYLSKPFGNKQLIETVEKALEVKRLTRESERLHQGLVDKLKPVGIRLERPAPQAASGWTFRRVTDVLLLIALLSIAGLFGARRFIDQRVSGYPSPGQNPTALAWRENRLWAADWVKQSVYEFERTGGELRVLRSVMIPRSHLTGLTIAEGAAYTCDSWSHTIQKRNLDEALSLVFEVPSPGPSPSALFWDGRYLWSADSTVGRIFQHEPDAALTVVASFPSAAKTPVGLYKDNAFFWSADAETRRIYRHRLDEQLSVIGEYEIEALNEGTEPLSAIAYRRDAWWVGRDGAGRLFRFGKGLVHSVKRPANG